MKRIEPIPCIQPETHASGILSGNDLRIAGQISEDTKNRELPNDFVAKIHNSRLKLALRSGGRWRVYS